MRTLCYSVRLASIVRVSEKAYKVRAFDGSTDIIPVSQVFGNDYEVSKSDAYWISAWILERKSLQYSRKKSAWFDDSGHMTPTYTIERHTPEKREAKESNIINDLKR